MVGAGTVIDRKTLSRSGVALLSVASVVIPVIVALQPELHVADEAGSNLR